jgi:small-conductance mechanosensitive channel
VSDFWQRLLIAGIVIVAVAVVAKVVDWRIERRGLAAGAETRYKVLRRAIFSTIVFVGVLSALLVIPQVRALAGGVLASSAVLGLVIGFASQRTIGNVVAGVLIAITQPLRLGDEVEIGGVRGVVEEIGLTYTWIRTYGGERLVVPNEKLASDSITNATIRNTEGLATIKIQVPGNADLRTVLAGLQELGGEVYVTDIGDKATIEIRRRVPLSEEPERSSSELRLAVAERLRQLGVLGT